MAIAHDPNVERLPVSSYAVVHVGKRDAGEYYRILDLDGTVIEEAAKVASHGTVFVGNAYAGGDVLVHKTSPPEDDDADE